MDVNELASVERAMVMEPWPPTPDPLAPYRLADGTIDVDALELGRPTPGYGVADRLDAFRARRLADLADDGTGWPIAWEGTWPRESLGSLERRFAASLRDAGERRAEQVRARRRGRARCAWAFAAGYTFAVAIVGGLLLARL